jgi:hypothetical protein
MKTKFIGTLVDASCVDPSWAAGFYSDDPVFLSGARLYELTGLMGTIVASSWEDNINKQD